jgi:hypothetical protein
MHKISRVLGLIALTLLLTSNANAAGFVTGVVVGSLISSGSGSAQAQDQDQNIVIEATGKTIVCLPNSSATACRISLPYYLEAYLGMEDYISTMTGTPYHKIKITGTKQIFHNGILYSIVIAYDVVEGNK